MDASTGPTMSCQRITPLRRNFPAAMVVPVQASTLLVPRMVGNGVPAGSPNIRAGMVMSPPPPTTASMKPATNEASVSRARVMAVMSREL